MAELFKTTKKRHERQLSRYQAAKQKIATDHLYGDFAWPDGLICITEFLTPDEGQLLQNNLKNTLRFQGLTSAGPTDHFVFSKNDLSKLPPSLNLGQFNVFRQCTAIHLRKHTEPILNVHWGNQTKHAVGVVIVGSDVTLKFAERNCEEQLGDMFQLPVPDNSLLLISEHALQNYTYSYEHTQNNHFYSLTYVQ